MNRMLVAVVVGAALVGQMVGAQACQRFELQDGSRVAELCPQVGGYKTPTTGLSSAEMDSLEELAALLASGDESKACSTATLEYQCGRLFPVCDSEGQPAQPCQCWCEEAAEHCATMSEADCDGPRSQCMRGPDGSVANCPWNWTLIGGIAALVVAFVAAGAVWYRISTSTSYAKVQ